MGESRTSRLIKAVDTLTGWMAVLIILALGGLYFWASSWAVTEDTSWWFAALRSLILALTANILPVFLLFVGSYLLLRRIQQIKEEEQHDALAQTVATEVNRAVADLRAQAVIERFNEVSWDRLISKSTRIDIVVHYFDTWINLHTDAIKEFLAKRDARLRIVLPNHEDDSLLEIIKGRFPEMDLENLRHKIKNTSAKLCALHDEAKATKAALKMYRSPTLQWYCAVRFDESAAVLSMYEGARTGGTRAPAVVVDLAQHPRVADWLSREIDQAVRVSTEEAVNA